VRRRRGSSRAARIWRSCGSWGQAIDSVRDSAGGAALVQRAPGAAAVAWAAHGGRRVAPMQRAWRSCSSVGGAWRAAGSTSAARIWRSCSIGCSGLAAWGGHGASRQCGVRLARLQRMGGQVSYIQRRRYGHAATLVARHSAWRSTQHSLAGAAARHACYEADLTPPMWQLRECAGVGRSIECA
jgi:hypothetical protein